MSGYCTIHDTKLYENESRTKFNEDGSPKTYWSHKGPDGICFGESMKKGQANGRTFTPKPQVKEQVREDKPDWDAIAAGKVRHAFALEAYKMNHKLNQETILEIDNWVNYVMSGRVAKKSNEGVDDLDPEYLNSIAADYS